MPDVRRLRRDAGQSLVEYALLLALICLVAVSVVGAVGEDVDGVLQQVSSALSPAAVGEGDGAGAGGGAGEGEGAGGHGAGGNGQGNNGNGNGNGGPSGESPGGGRGGGGRP